MTIRKRLATIEAQYTFMAFFFMFTMFLTGKGVDDRIVSAAWWTLAIGLVVTVAKLIFARTDT